MNGGPPRTTALHLRVYSVYHIPDESIYLNGAVNVVHQTVRLSSMNIPSVITNKIFSLFPILLIVQYSL